MTLLEADRKILNYRLIRHAGSGGYGSVWQARDLQLDRDVALKFFVKLSATTAVRKLVMEEPKIMGRLTSERARRGAENIVYINHAYEGDDTIPPFLDLEWVEGGSLQDRLDEDVSIGYDELLILARQLTSALICAHSHDVIHCDIKPSNVLSSRMRRVYKLSDFGLARRVSTVTGRSWGTPPYMSPEQFLQPDSVDHKTDVYSLSILLYRCAEGRLPYAGRNWKEYRERHCKDPIPDIRNPHVPEGMKELIYECMSKRADRRPDLSAIRARLRQLDSGAVPELSLASRVSALDVVPDTEPPVIVHRKTALRFMAMADGTYMAQRLATNRDYFAFLSDSRNQQWRSEKLPFLSHDGGYLDGWALGHPRQEELDLPVRGIPHAAARAFADWVGGVLPSSAEMDQAMFAERAPIGEAIDKECRKRGDVALCCWCRDGVGDGSQSDRAMWRYLGASKIGKWFTQTRRPKHYCLPNCVLVVGLPLAVTDSVRARGERPSARAGEPLDGSVGATDWVSGFDSLSGDKDGDSLS